MGQCVPPPSSVPALSPRRLWICVGRALSSMFLRPAVAARGEAGGGRRPVFVASGAGWWSLVFLLRPAEVARGADARVGSVQRVVALGAASTAGRWVEARGRRCGRAHSSGLDSVAARRMDLTAFYNAWWCSFSEDGGTASTAAPRILGRGQGSDCSSSRQLRVLFALSQCPCNFLFAWGPVCKCWAS